MTALGRIMSRSKAFDCSASLIDHSRSGQATVNSDFSGAPYRFGVIASKRVPHFLHSAEWDVYEEDVPQY